MLTPCPGEYSALTSGHTTRLPQKLTRSPALARSQLLARRMTSMVRGSAPPGIWGSGAARRVAWERVLAWLLSVRFEGAAASERSASC
jgi:hypothetical protein